MPICEIHHKELICPSCRAAEGGRIGGKSRSKAKLEAARRTIRQTPNFKVRAKKKKKQ